MAIPISIAVINQGLPVWEYNSHKMILLFSSKDLLRLKVAKAVPEVIMLAMSSQALASEPCIPQANLLVTRNKTPVYWYLRHYICSRLTLFIPTCADRAADAFANSIVLDQFSSVNCSTFKVIFSYSCCCQILKRGFQIMYSYVIVDCKPLLYKTFLRN